MLSRNAIALGTALLAVLWSASHIQASHAGGADEPSKIKQLISEGIAAWYRVPINSLARRRAGPNEFTAAHNRLPIGTLVRVTRISNGKTVVVRITDRGIADPRATIDLCREAAERLRMVRIGMSRVRLEIIPEGISGPIDGDSVLSWR